MKKNEASIQKAASNLKKKEGKRPSVLLQEKLALKMSSKKLDESDLTASLTSRLQESHNIDKLFSVNGFSINTNYFINLSIKMQQRTMFGGT